MSENVWSRRIDPNLVAPFVARARALGALSEDHPAVVFHDLGLMRARICSLHALYPEGTLHALAIKANPLSGVLRAAVEAGAGLEAASLGEVHLALEASCPAERIVFDSPAKTRAELARALELGATVNADNLSELERIASLDPPAGARVGLRVNPLVGDGAIDMTSTAGRTSKFGEPLDATGLPAVLDAYARYPWLCGLHAHVGSQGMALSVMTAAAKRVDGLRRDIDARRGHTQITFMDLGGGLPARYSDVTTPTMPEYVDALRAAVPDLFAPGAPMLVTEFGRAIQANCGWAISQVEYAKRSAHGPIAVLHLGADFMLRRAYRPDAWHYEFAPLSPDAEPLPGGLPVTLAGPLCFSGDILARDAPIGPLAEGDLVLYHDVGGYTLSMWSRYCSRPIPAILGYDTLDEPDSLHTLRRAETLDDVARFWSRDLD